MPAEKTSPFAPGGAKTAEVTFNVLSPGQRQLMTHLRQVPGLRGVGILEDVGHSIIIQGFQDAETTAEAGIPKTNLGDLFLTKVAGRKAPGESSAANHPSSVPGNAEAGANRGHHARQNLALHDFTNDAVNDCLVSEIMGAAVPDVPKL